jgi:hypothetical protein
MFFLVVLRPAPRPDYVLIGQSGTQVRDRPNRNEMPHENEHQSSRPDIGLCPTKRATVLGWPAEIHRFVFKSSRRKILIEQAATATCPVGLISIF